MPSKSFLQLNPDYAKKIPRSFEALQKAPKQVLKERRAERRRKEIMEATALSGDLGEEAARCFAKGSTLERAFYSTWLRVAGPSAYIHPVWEHRFSVTRKWKFDFAWPDVRVFVELEGGAWSRGRHSRGAGFIGDCQKYNAATLNGWAGFRLPTGGVTVPAVKQIHDFIFARFVELFGEASPAPE